MIANCGMPWYMTAPLVAILFLCVVALLLLIITIFIDP